jgi:hypothetical protein
MERHITSDAPVDPTTPGTGPTRCSMSFTENAHMGHRDHDFGQRADGHPDPASERRDLHMVTSARDACPSNTEKYCMDSGHQNTLPCAFMRSLDLQLPGVAKRYDRHHCIRRRSTACHSIMPSPEKEGATTPQLHHPPGSRGCPSRSQLQAFPGGWLLGLCVSDIRQVIRTCTPTRNR